MTVPILPEIRDPVRYDRDALDACLRTLVAEGASDVLLVSESPVRAYLRGRWETVGTRALKTHELADVLNAIDMGNASSMVASGQARNIAYEVSLGSRTSRLRFRVNATGVRRSGDRDLKIVLRSIPDTPPTLDSMKLPPGLVEALFPLDGLVGVAGITGSGKSTLLAAVLRSKLEKGGCHIATAEAPIEFVYDKVETRDTGIIVQSEVPTHHPSFGKAVEEMLRQKPDAILVGESRDAETIGNTVKASQTGHASYTTAHTNGVGETIGRMTDDFPGPERDAAAAKLLSAMRVLVHQRLLRRADGSGRVPVREWLVFDRDVKRTLFADHWSRWPVLISDILEERGQSSAQDAKRAFEAGLITKEDFLAVERGA
jgi:defect-in-organelle-trafficking protein DotB